MRLYDYVNRFVYVVTVLKCDAHCIILPFNRIITAAYCTVTVIGGEALFISHKQRVYTLVKNNSSAHQKRPFFGNNGMFIIGRSEFVVSAVAMIKTRRKSNAAYYAKA